MSKTYRIRAIDAMRGFTMLLVVLAHVESFTFGIYPYTIIWGNFFISFRMPLFFFISGFITYKTENLDDNSYILKDIKRRTKIQLIPTLIFFSIFQIINWNNPFTQLFNYGFEGYWFTVVLLEMFLITLILSFLPRKIFNIIIIFISILFIGILGFDRPVGTISRILCLENLLKYFQFFTLGILCKQNKIKVISFLNNDKVRSSIYVSFIVLLLLMTRTTWGCESLFSKNVIRSILVRYAGMFAVVSFFLSKKEYFEKNNIFNKCLIFTGTHTLDIYLLHYFFIPSVFVLPDYIKQNFILEFSLAFFLSIIIIFVCICISHFIRTSNILGHILFGVPKL